MSLSLRKISHRTEQLRRVGVATAHDTIECEFRFVAPVPRINERLDLRVGLLP